jgi:hypothetical protein
MRVMFAGHTPADAVYLAELDVHAEDLKTDAAKPSPVTKPAKPVTKRPRAPRKDSRSKMTKDLPGFFDVTRKDRDLDSD